jgi:hypothetical protein
LKQMPGLKQMPELKQMSGPPACGDPGILGCAAGYGLAQSGTL